MSSPEAGRELAEFNIAQTKYPLDDPRMREFVDNVDRINKLADKLPGFVWQKLNLAWVLFFSALGVLNLYVAYNFTLSTWVDFKAFGVTGLIVLFTLAQGLYLSKYLPSAPDGKDDTP